MVRVYVHQPTLFLAATHRAPPGSSLSMGVGLTTLRTKKDSFLAWIMDTLDDKHGEQRTDKSKGPEQERKKMSEAILEQRYLFMSAPRGFC